MILELLLKHFKRGFAQADLQDLLCSVHDMLSGFSHGAKAASNPNPYSNMPGGDHGSAFDSSNFVISSL